MPASSTTDDWINGPLNAARVMPMEREAVLQRFEAEAMPHLRDITRTAVRLVGDRTRAEDMVQEVFLEAWKSFHRFEPGTNCRAWLFKILMHRVQHLRRKWFRLRFFCETDELFESSLTYTPPVPEHLTDEDVVGALGRISEDFRAVVLLVDVEGFSYKETSEILGVPIGTVMSRLSRARRLLREHLAGVAQSYGFGKTEPVGQKL